VIQIISLIEDFFYVIVIFESNVTIPVLEKISTTQKSQRAQLRIDVIKFGWLGWEGRDSLINMG